MSSRCFKPEARTDSPIVLAGAIALLSLLFWAGYWHVMASDWRGDDPDHLTTVQNLGLKGLHRLFIDQELWSLVSMQNFTPINVAMYGLWVKLFGPRPAPAYAGHLFNLFLLALAYFAWLLRYVRLPVALGFTVLCFASLPVYELANELMSDHYALGALFAVLALHAFDEAPRRGARFWLAGALLAVLAALSKEIFGFVVLYPLLRELLAAPPVWLDRDALRRRFGAPLLALLPMVGFALWRRAMLGQQTGGYGFYAHIQPGHALSYVFGDHVVEVTAAMALALIALGFSRGWRAVAAALLLALYVALPSLFIPAMLARHWLLPLLGIGFFLALTWPTDFSRSLRASTAVTSTLLLGGLLLHHSISGIPPLRNAMREQSAEMRTLVERMKQQPLNAEITDTAGAQKLMRAGKICAIELPTDVASGCQGKLTLAGQPLEAFRDAARLDALCSAPLHENWRCEGRTPFTITGHYQNQVLSWRSTPCPAGRNTVIYKPDSYRNQLYNGLDRRLEWLVSLIPCQAEAAISVSGLKWLDMMVVMDDAQGGTVITPLFRADLGRGAYQQTLEALHLKPADGPKR
jgi:hypothetical protein